MPVKALIPAHFAAELRQRTGHLDTQLIPYDKKGVPMQDATGATAFFRWWLSEEQGDAVIRNFPDLRWIHSGSAGIDHILTPTFRASGIVLTNSSGVHAPSIAEWVSGWIIAVEKDFAAMISQQRERVWEKVERDELSSKHVVILGGGHIGSEIARRLRPFGVKLTCVRRTSEAHRDFDETRDVAELREAVATCDWLIVAIPLTAASRGMISREVLAAMPPTARIVNVARGEIINEAALLHALEERRIAGAVLDVFEEEPLPADHELWSLPGVVVLPHTTWRSPLVKERQLALFADNLQRFVRGEALVNVVDVNAMT